MSSTIERRLSRLEREAGGESVEARLSVDMSPVERQQRLLALHLKAQKDPVAWESWIRLWNLEVSDE